MDNPLWKKYRIWYDNVAHEWRGVTREKWERIVREFPSQNHAAHGLKTSKDTLRRFEEKWGGGWDKTHAPVATREVEPPDGIIMLEEPRLSLGDFIIAPDPHVPYHNAPLLNEMCRFARKYGIKSLLIPGDFWDNKVLYKKDVQTEGTSTHKMLDMGGKIIDVLTGTFSSIDMLMGNHCWRLLRQFGTVEMGVGVYQKWLGGARFSKFNYALVNDWLYVHHPFKMRKVKGSLPEEMGDHNKKSNYIAHSHRLSFGVHDNGEDLIAEGLHMTDPRYHDYLMMRSDVFSTWVPGFWYVIDNKMGMYAKHPRIYNPMEV